MVETTKSFRQLRVWQQAIDFAEAIYDATESFPKHEVYSLSQQLRRAAVSVPSNIAEGSTRANKGEFIQFLYIAKASLAEVETQLIIAMRRNYVAKNIFDTLTADMLNIEKMLVKLILSMKNKPSTLNLKLSTM